MRHSFWLALCGFLWYAQSVKQLPIYESWNPLTVRRLGIDFSLLHKQSISFSNVLHFLITSLITYYFNVVKIVTCGCKVSETWLLLFLTSLTPDAWFNSSIVSQPNQTYLLGKRSTLYLQQDLLNEDLANASPHHFSRFDQWLVLFGGIAIMSS